MKLASNADVELAQGGKGKGKGGPGKQDGLLPSSLRAGLFSALQEIGGPEAEQLLAQSLGGNSRPDEVLRLAQMLEQMAPGKYRDTVLAAAQAQLSAGAAGQSARDAGQLYDVLAMYGDKSYVEQARTQLLQADGRLNKDALDYLQTSLKQENLPLLKELLQNPQITDPNQKEDVMKYVTELAGTDQQANQFWTVDQTRARLTILMDPNLRQALQGQPKGGKIK